MPTTTIRDGSSVATCEVNSSWQDVTTRIPGSLGVAGLLRKISGDGVVQVVKGGASAPDANSPPGDIIMMPGDSVYCESSDIWVRCRTGSAILCFETI